MKQALVVVEEHTGFLADSRQVAHELGIGHNDFFTNLIKKYQSEIESDFGVLRFQNVKPQKGSRGGRPQSYALLTEDQTFAYLAYSQNTEQARRCKRNLVKAFALAREIIRTHRLCPEAELEGFSLRQVRVLGIIGQIIETDKAGLPRRHLVLELTKEVRMMTPQEQTWEPFPQSVRLLR